MAEKEKSAPTFDVRTALLVAFVAGGAFLIHPPLQSSRPHKAESRQREALGDEVVPARLWQDPFEAARAYLRKRSKATQASGKPPETRPAINELNEQISRHLLPPNAIEGHGVTILEVMVSGGSYAEDAEERNRVRYAVLSALGAAHYVPADEDHIGCIQIAWPRGRDLEVGTNHLKSLEALSSPEGSMGQKLLVPYEWYSPSELQPPRKASDVLVIWLNGDLFDDHPAIRVAQFNQAVKKGLRESDIRSKQGLQFKLINPRLKYFLDDLDSITKVDNQFSAASYDNLINVTNELTGLEIYSSWGTTADAVLIKDATERRRESVKQKLLENGPVFFNATCTDDELIDALIEELQLRGVDLADPTQAVALVSEWDTFYGRSLPQTFAGVVKCRRDDFFTAASFIGTNFGWLKTNAVADPIVYHYVTNCLSRDSGVPFGYNAGAYSADALAIAFNQLLTNRLCFDSNNFPGIKEKDLSGYSRGSLIHTNRQILQGAFPGGICKNSLANAIEALRTNELAWPSNVWRFKYLRDIDGLLPGDDEVDPSPLQTVKQDDNSKEQHPAEETPRAEGHSQMDYLPRLAVEIEDKEREAQRQSKCELKAVGILGSDVYDKLLVLQSLRSRLKDELFFTTDLDARLLHPAQWKWTRNLIVASSFGLQLAPTWQREIPPFRDTYQCGTYLACQAALGIVDTNDLWTLAPRVFEVGRNGAYDLSIAADPAGIHPVRRKSELLNFFGRYPKSSLLVIFCAPVALLSFYSTRIRAILGMADGYLLPSSASPEVADGKACLRAENWKSEPPGKPTSLFEALKAAWVRGDTFIFDRLARARERLDGRPQQWMLRIGAGACVAGLAGLGWAIFNDHFDLRGEPFSLTDGISIWPAELIRLISAGLAVYFMGKSMVELAESQQKLDRRFHISQTSLGKKYHRDTLPERRVARALCASLIYVLFVAVIFCMAEAPYEPYRGAFSLKVDRVALLVSVAAQILLIFLVIDAANLCRKFIEDAEWKSFSWPPELIKELQKCAHAGISNEHLTEYVRIQAIAARTEAVGSLILYPFITLFLMIVARTSFFAPWDWPRSLVLVMALNAVLAVAAFWKLRSSAERARRQALTILRKQRLDAVADPKRESAAATLDAMIQEVESCAAGAFAPITQHPFVHALLLAAGGIGLEPLMNLLTSRL